MKRFIDLNLGDILVFYKSKEGFAGIYKVVSDHYKDTTTVWDDDIYPNRVKIEPVVSLKPQQYVDAKTMVDDLEMVTHPQYWGIAFRENLKELSKNDYELIKSKLEKACK
ncbi:MAG: EVE domain-containing protein [Vampirovibrionia bacterium]